MKALFNLKAHFQAFREIADLLTCHRQLIWELTKREISDRYAGQVFGTLWVIGHPMILMCIYVFIFSFVLRMKVGGTRELPLDYTVYLLSGLIPWMAFQEAMSKSSMVIIGNANLVKQVMFPLEVLPVKSIIASLMTQLVSTLALASYTLISHGLLPWTYFLIPLVFLFQLLAMIGVSYILAAIGVYFRDLKDFVQVFCVAGMYIMPIFYLPSAVPVLFRPILYLNPFSYLIWCYQDVFYFGRLDHLWAWLVLSVGSMLVFCSGYRLFRKLKVMFGNVL
jgi:lipopolysaccharide transport system permease protein